jgi:hypothetical protein
MVVILLGKVRLPSGNATSVGGKSACGLHLTQIQAKMQGLSQVTDFESGVAPGGPVGAASHGAMVGLQGARSAIKNSKQ